MEDLNEKARRIIEQIIYITLATVSESGEPWVSPLYSAYNEQYNFYWVSGHKTRHSKNILNNGKAALAIYDSTAAEGTGEGVYIQGRATELNDEKEIIHAAKYLYGRKNKPPRDTSWFTGDSPRRIYKVTPDKIWINGTEYIGKHPVDVREEVSLKQ